MSYSIIPFKGLHVSYSLHHARLCLAFACCRHWTRTDTLHHRVISRASHIYVGSPLLSMPNHPSINTTHVSHSLSWFILLNNLDNKCTFRYISIEHAFGRVRTVQPLVHGVQSSSDATSMFFQAAVETDGDAPPAIRHGNLQHLLLTLGAKREHQRFLEPKSY
jgi:hypothetical protein